MKRGMGRKSLKAGFTLLMAMALGFSANSIGVREAFADGETLTVADYGAVGNCIADDTAALESAANAGAVVALVPGQCYKITSTIDITTTNSGLTGDGSAKIYMPAASFSNTDNSFLGGRYASNAVGIHVRGGLTSPYAPIKNVVLRNLVIESEVASSSDRVLRAIVLSNVSHPIVDGNEMFGFPQAIGIVGRTLDGGSLSRNYIHDFYDASTGFSGNPALKQSTGIEIDNDLINAVASKGLLIQANTIRSITMSGAAIAAYGYQTDGINVARNTSSGHTIADNIIDNVGEGVDLFGNHMTVSGNVISNSYAFNLKLIHGASYNTLYGNTLTNCGMACIVLAGTNENSNVQFNVVTSNICTNVDPNSVWAATADTGCVLTFPDSSYTYKAVNNTIADNIFVPGATGQYAIVRKATGPNYYVNNVVQAGAAGKVFAGSETGYLISVDGLSGGGGSSGTFSKVTSTTAANTGAASTALVLANPGLGAGTEVIIDMAPNSVGEGVRSAQIAAVADGAATSTALVFRTGNGQTPTERLRITPDGRVIVDEALVVPFGAPASSTATCTRGEIRFDATYIYTCVAANSWHRTSNGASW